MIYLRQLKLLLLLTLEVFCHKPKINTVKFLIGVTPQGVISFIPKAWGGRTPDKHLTKNCGVMKYLLPGDVILAGRGFDIGDSDAHFGATVEIPAFTTGKQQLSAFVN